MKFPKKIINFLFRDKKESGEHVPEGNLEQIILSSQTPSFEGKRVAIYIDGSNLYYSVKNCTGSKLSYNGLKEFCEEIAGDNVLSKIGYYFSPMTENENPISYFSDQNFIKGLRSLNKCDVVLGRLEKINGSYVEKETDVNLAVDIISDAYENIFDIAYLVSNDGDFRRVFDNIHKKINGKKVIYVSVGKDYPICSYLYNSAADTIIRNRCDMCHFVNIP